MRTREITAQRGSISLWAALIAFCSIIIVGIAVDFGGQAIAEQRARTIAFEAARAGGQQLHLDALAHGRGLQPDPARARREAQDYLARAGSTGSVIVSGATITVTVQGTYRCAFLSVIGITALPANGSSSADIVRVYQGAPR